MAHGPTPWPKGRSRIKVAKQVGYTRPSNAKDVGNIVLVRPLIEELIFRGPVALATLVLGWEAGIVVAIISTVIFCAMHWKSYGGDVADFVTIGLKVYIFLSLRTSVAVITCSAIWSIPGAFWGMVIAIVLHAWGNSLAEVEEYSQDKFKFSPMGELNAWTNRKRK